MQPAVQPEPSVDVTLFGTFNGEATQWQRFRRAFEQAVHANNQLTDVQRMSYLHAALIGRPALMVSTNAGGAQQYAQAWWRLNQHYNSEYVQRESYFKELFAMPRIRAENRASVRLLRTEADIFTHLRAMNYNIDGAADMIMYTITRCFTSNMRIEWENWCKLVKPTLSEVRAFLIEYERRVDEQQMQPSTSRMQTASSSASAPTATVQSSNAATPTAALQTARASQSPCGNRRRESSASRSSGNGQRAPQRMCPACPGMHFLQQCPVFRALSTSERQRRVQAWGICQNCFRNTHSLSQCPYGPCRNFSGRQWHNSMLCRAHEMRTRRDADAVQSAPTQATSASSTSVQPAATIADATSAEQVQQPPATGAVARYSVHGSFRRLERPTKATDTHVSWPFPNAEIQLNFPAQETETVQSTEGTSTEQQNKNMAMREQENDGQNDGRNTQPVQIDKVQLKEAVYRAIATCSPSELAMEDFLLESQEYEEMGNRTPE